MLDSSTRKYYFIDLFAGAGGLSEGFIQAGFDAVAHVEMNRFAADTLTTRTAYHLLKRNNQSSIYYNYLRGIKPKEAFYNLIPESVKKTIICKTMSNETLPDIFRTIDGIMTIRGIQKPDVIVGGPPCQAYSLVGRAQSSHMKTPMKDDPRNDLYKLYARFLQHYRPKLFVFENVPGIESANGGTTWMKVKDTLRDAGYEIVAHEQNAKDFGVLQSRRRIIIVGWLKNSGLAYPEFEKVESNAIVNDLLADLPKLHPGEKSDKYAAPYDAESWPGRNCIREKDDVLTQHAARSNTPQDIEIYKHTIALWNHPDGHKRLNYNDLPDELKTHNNRSSFVDRFKVVEGDEPYCHTILAHLSKDGHYFIHPDILQARSITVREAARIQSFPDSYFFEGPRTAQFIQVGNAVPPMMAKKIAEGILKQLSRE